MGSSKTIRRAKNNQAESSIKAPKSNFLVVDIFISNKLPPALRILVIIQSQNSAGGTTNHSINPD